MRAPLGKFPVGVRSEVRPFFPPGVTFNPLNLASGGGEHLHPDLTLAEWRGYGSVMVKIAPPVGRLAADTSPSSSPTRCFTIARPSPVPPDSRDRALSTR